MKFLKLYIIYVFLFLIMFEYQICISAETNVESNVVNALRGMDDSRIRLRKGICHISGKTTKGQNSIDENISIYFDYDQGLYRFDRKDICHTLTTPEYYYEAWYPKTSNAEVTRQNIADKKPSYLAKPFDIQMLGFFGLAGPYWLDRYQPDFRLSLLLEKPVMYEVLSKDVILVQTLRIPALPGASQIGKKYWLSVKKGYSLIQADYDGIDKCELSWEEKNQVWVPKSFKLTSSQPYSAEWIIDWQSVNEDIPARFFDPVDLANDKTPIFSNELGVSVQIGSLGEKYSSPPSNPRVNRIRWFLMISGIIMIVVGLGKKIYDWRARQSK